MKLEDKWTMARLVCPKCGSHEIKTVEDKSKPMAYAGHAPVYKKVNVCKQCSERFEWSEFKGCMKPLYYPGSSV